MRAFLYFICTIILMSCIGAQSFDYCNLFKCRHCQQHRNESFVFCEVRAECGCINNTCTRLHKHHSDPCREQHCQYLQKRVSIHGERKKYSYPTFDEQLHNIRSKKSSKVKTIHSTDNRSYASVKWICIAQHKHNLRI